MQPKTPQANASHASAVEPNGTQSSEQQDLLQGIPVVSTVIQSVMHQTSYMLFQQAVALEIVQVELYLRIGRVVDFPVVMAHAQVPDQ